MVLINIAHKQEELIANRLVLFSLFLTTIIASFSGTFKRFYGPIGGGYLRRSLEVRELLTGP